MSGPWLYSAVDHAATSDWKPIQNTGSEPRISAMNRPKPTGFRVTELASTEALDWELVPSDSAT